MKIAVVGIRSIGNVAKGEVTIYDYVKKIEEDDKRNCYLLSFGGNRETEIRISKENFKIVLL